LGETGEAPVPNEVFEVKILEEEVPKISSPKLPFVPPYNSSMLPNVSNEALPYIVSDFNVFVVPEVVWSIYIVEFVVPVYKISAALLPVI
jgi:hypothetical protein